VLDVGSRYSPYKKFIPHAHYIRLDVDPTSQPDICVDIHEFSGYDCYFDAVIATEILEHCYDPQKAIDQVFQTLKNGGRCIITTRFMYPYHPHPRDYYRFTKDSLERLFRSFHYIEIKPHGGRLQSIWQIITTSESARFLRILNPLVARIPHDSNIFDTPCGFIVYAEK